MDEPGTRARGATGATGPGAAPAWVAPGSGSASSGEGGTGASRGHWKG